MSATTTAGAPAPARRIAFERHPLKPEHGTLVRINGQPAGRIFRNGRDGSYDFTLTDLGEATSRIRNRFTTTARYAGRDFRVYRRGLDTVGSLDVLKERIEDLVNR